MDNDVRNSIYIKQNGKSTTTSRQDRRVHKKYHRKLKKKGKSWCAICEGRG